MRNHGISVTNEVWILAAGECAGCWTGEGSWVDAWKSLMPSHHAARKWRVHSVVRMACCRSIKSWLDGYHDLVGNGSDRHQRDLREIMQISGWIAESLMLLPCLSLRGFSGVLLSRCRSLSSGNVAGLPTQWSANFWHVAAARISVPEQSSVANLSTANSVQCEVARRKNSVESTGSERRLTSALRWGKTWSTDTVALVFWLPNCLTAPMYIYIDTRQIDCVQWLELETMRVLGGEWDTLCVLWEAAKRMSFVCMPCIWHMH